MINFIYTQILFYISIAIILFIPGYFLLLTLKKKLDLTALEIFVFSVGLSYVISTFLLIIIDRINIPLNRLNIFLTLTIFSLILLIVAFLKNKKNILHYEKNSITSKGAVTFLLILFLALLFRVLFVIPQSIPYSTDLGHHMYWVEKIVETQKLPAYQKEDISQSNGIYYIKTSIPISDFIIGEHVVLAGIKILSRAEITSLFSIIVLFILNIMAILTVYIITLRIFETETNKFNIAILSFFFIAVLYCLDPPQMKYVTGGVIGNTISNFLILMTTTLTLISIKKKEIIYLVLAILSFFGLFYIHHLSTLLFGLIILFSFIFLIIANLFELRKFFTGLLFIFKSPFFYISLGIFIFFILFIKTPSYIANSAIDTVIGEPTSAEHLGLSFSQLKYQLGEPRIIFGLFGLFILLLSKKLRKNEGVILLFGWTVPLIILTLFPTIVKISIPSGRIANYLIFPFSILTSYTLIWTFEKIKNQHHLSSALKYLAIIFFISIIIHNGIYNNVSQMLTYGKNYQKILSVFNASTYLDNNIPSDENIVHDHINILGDSWIKVHLMKDYNYPFYRANLFRYDRISDKQENCTLDIISNPDSENSLKCLEDLKITTILVNKFTDSQLFKKSKKFSQIYSDQFNNIYHYEKNIK